MSQAANNDCVFCKIINKEIPARIVFEDENILAFYDIKPKADVHVLVIPKKHISALSETQENHQSLLGQLLFRAKEIAKQMGLSDNFNIVLNNGVKAGQAVQHLHFHLLSGWKNPHQL